METLMIKSYNNAKPLDANDLSDELKDFAFKNKAILFFPSFNTKKADSMEISE